MYRLAAVSFLNTKPLIAGLTGRPDVELTLDVPARLPALLDRGEVDAALVPIVDVIRSGGRWSVISNACIGSDGETMTVRVFSQKPPDRVERIFADTDSHTSVALVRVLWRELYGRTLAVEPLDTRRADLATLDSVLLIGDKVIDPRRRGFAFEVDLGGAWRQHTGLPFVFAVWAENTNDQAIEGLRDQGIDGTDGHRSKESTDRRLEGLGGREGGPASGREVELRDTRAQARQQDRNERGTNDVATTTVVRRRIRVSRRQRRPGPELAALLSESRELRLPHLREIARREGPVLGWPMELAERYLTRCLTFTLDARHIEGANLFATLCARYGVVPDAGEIDWPVEWLAAR